VEEMHSARPKEQSLEILSDSDYLTEVASTTLIVRFP